MSRTSMLAAQPELRAASGWHGISLLRHAGAGGEQAQPIVALLGG